MRLAMSDEIAFGVEASLLLLLAVSQLASGKGICCALVLFLVPALTLSRVLQLRDIRRARAVPRMTLDLRPEGRPPR